MKDLTVALAGNPNVGKSTVFNHLTGLKQHTGNWAGKTVDTACGTYSDETGKIRFVDLPGTYSLFSRSPEEEIARAYIESGEADCTAVVCDASCLERNLILVLQIMSVTGHVTVCVNLMDEAQKKGIEIDLELLEKRLGVPVIGTCAARGEGIEELLAAVRSSADSACELHAASTRQEIAEQARAIAEECVKGLGGSRIRRERKIDRVLTGRITGIPIMLLMLLGILWLTVSGANYPSEILSDGLFFVGGQIRSLMVSLGAPWWLTGVLIDGIYNTTAWVVGVMLPPMAIFFPLFTILEDLGYLPRVAFNLDHAFKQCGSCGKQALTM